MSKLSFVEDTDFGMLDERSHEIEGSDPESSVNEDIYLSTSSYALMGVEAKGGNSTATLRTVDNIASPSLCSGGAKEEGVNSPILEASPVTHGSALSVAHPTPASANSNSDSNKPTVKVSRWLQEFLQSKKESGSVPPKPVIIPLSDMFIAEFVGSTRAHLRDAECGEISETSSDHSSDKDTGFSKTMYDGEETEATDFDKIQLKLFNLPYNMSETEIEDQARLHGVCIRNVTLLLDRATKLPRGMATAELMPVHDVDKGEIIKSDGAVSILTGQDFGGRPLRVETFGPLDKNKARRSSTGGSRYFGGSFGINVKCNICGEVGHRQADCVADSAIPCHLCARPDHDPVDCPNLICFRCGDFGHHSKACTSYYATDKPVLCTVCGGTTHDNRACRKRFGNLSLEKVEGSHIVCMACGKFGHALCRRTLPAVDRNIYCPDCGEKGHHVDFPDLGSLCCRVGNGGRYSDYGGRNLGINYSSEVIKDRDYSRRRKSNSDYCSKRKADYSSTSDSDELEAYMKDLNRSGGSGRTIMVGKEEAISKKSHKRNRRSY